MTLIAAATTSAHKAAFDIVSIVPSTSTACTTLPMTMTTAARKIKVDNPVVDMDGDEMTRIIGGGDQRAPDLSLSRHRSYVLRSLRPKRDATNDHITIDAANATKEVGVAVKCATITPDEGRVKEFNLRECGEPQRHHPQHSRRRHLSRTDHLQERGLPRWAGRSRSSSGATPTATSTARPISSSRPAGTISIKFTGDGRQGDRARSFQRA